MALSWDDPPTAEPWCPEPAEREPETVPMRPRRDPWEHYPDGAPVPDGLDLEGAFE